MLTDCCGSAVKHEFKDGPFVEGGRDEITCHEGILLSAKRLAEDLMTFVESVLLPSGYKITVTGHSLGEFLCWVDGERHYEINSTGFHSLLILLQGLGRP